MVEASLFKSDKQDWGTPRSCFDPLHNEFRFDVDVCAHAFNHKLPTYWTEQDDALSFDWPAGRVYWCNPPYDNVEAWMRKCLAEARRGSTVVCLVPSRTDTRWWHRHVHGHAHEVRLVVGRLRFEGAPQTAPFPSAVVVYRPGPLPTSTHYTSMPRA